MIHERWIGRATTTSSLLSEPTDALHEVNGIFYASESSDNVGRDEKMEARDERAESTEVLV